jgi:phenylacetate-CoA ligase
VKYSQILESGLMPAYYNLRGRSYPRVREFMERSQWWPAWRIYELQWQEMRRLLKHAFRAVPYYQRKYAAAGIELEDIRTREDFAKLPALTREEVSANRSELCSRAYTQRLIPHATGGSSGVPTRFYITPESYDWRCAATARAYSWAGHRIGERILYLWGGPVGKVPFFQRAKLNSYRFFRRERFVPTFVQTPEVWQQTFEAAMRFRPRFIMGYVSSLERFAQFLLERDLTIPGLHAVIAGAEPVNENARELAEQAFRAPLFDTYGSREFMSIAAECEHHRGLHIHADNLLVETELDADLGPSEMLVTDLHNYGMPFIRYQIGDVGLLSKAECPCGRGLPLIERIEGRTLEVLRTRDGRAISPILWRHVLKDIAEIREFQIQQEAIDEIVISIVLTDSLSRRSETLLRTEMAKVFTPATRLTIKKVECIPQLPSGKRRLAVSIGRPA